MKVMATALWTVLLVVFLVWVVLPISILLLLAKRRRERRNAND